MVEVGSWAQLTSVGCAVHWSDHPTCSCGADEGRPSQSLLAALLMCSLRELPPNPTSRAVPLWLLNVHLHRGQLFKCSFSVWGSPLPRSAWPQSICSARIWKACLSLFGPGSCGVTEHECL